MATALRFCLLIVLVGLSFGEPDYTFDDVQQGLKDNSMFLIDVRNRDEIETLGKIPTSNNFPLPEVEMGLVLTEETFLEMYGFEKPKKEYPDGKLNVIYCASGVRARKAAEIFENFGYQNYRVYAGSFQDWVAKGGEVVFDK